MTMPEKIVAMNLEVTQDGTGTNRHRRAAMVTTRMRKTTRRLEES